MTQSRFAAFRLARPSRFVPLSIAVLVSACTPYRIDIQQGNIVTAEQFAQLKPGMTREQIRFALGTPLLTDVFHDRRWDYFYHYEQGQSRAIEQRRLTVWFGQDNRVERIDADAAMQALPPDATGGARAYDLTPVAGNATKETK
jgi:outer membrane protein assembly factor BamE